MRAVFQGNSWGRLLLQERVIKVKDTAELTQILNNLKFTSDFWLVMLPSILMALDVATGFINAWAKNIIQSSIMRQGLARKFGELTVIAIGQLFFYGLGLPKYCVGFISFYIILMELVSIAENLDKLGVPIPKFIKKVLSNANKKIDEIGEDPKEKQEEPAENKPVQKKKRSKKQEEDSK